MRPHGRGGSLPDVVRGVPVGIFAQDGDVRSCAIGARLKNGTNNESVSLSPTIGHWAYIYLPL